MEKAKSVNNLGHAMMEWVSILPSPFYVNGPRMDRGDSGQPGKKGRDIECCPFLHFSHKSDSSLSHFQTQAHRLTASSKPQNESQSLGQKTSPFFLRRTTTGKREKFFAEERRTRNRFPTTESSRKKGFFIPAEAAVPNSFCV